MAWVIGKKTGGWWFVRELCRECETRGMFTFPSEAEAVTDALDRNRDRLAGKFKAASMARDEAEQAKLSYSAAPVVIYLERDKEGKTP